MSHTLLGSRITALVIFGMMTAAGQTPIPVMNVDIPGALSSAAHGVNNLGDVVGEYSGHGFIRYAGTGQVVTVDYPGADWTILTGINDSRTTVGRALKSGKTIGFTRTVNGLFSAIEYPGADTTWANGINNAGTVVGTYNNVHGFIRNANGEFTAVDVDARGTQLMGINNNGAIVGIVPRTPMSMTQQGQCAEAFLRAPGGTVETLYVSPCMNTISVHYWDAIAVAMNDLGEATVSFRSCYYVCQAATNLKRLATGDVLDLSLSVDGMVEGINTAGMVVGSYGSFAFASGSCAPIATTANPLSFSAGGGVGTLTVSSSAGCLWRLDSPGWIRFGDLIPPVVQSGPKVIPFTVEATGTTEPRTGNIAVAGQSIPITQDAGTCTYSLTSDRDVPSTTGPFYSARLLTLFGCSWTATSSAPWLRVRSPGTGPGYLDIAVDQNPSFTNPRQATITVGPASLTLTQQPQNTTASGFVAIPPCRAIDTRLSRGPTKAGETLYVEMDWCASGSGMTAWAVNITVVPKGPLGYLSAWSADQPQPLVSTLNSTDGRIVANSAMIPAGPSKKLAIYTTDPTDVVVDVTGFYIPYGGLRFDAIAPCRAIDTRITGTPLVEVSSDYSLASCGTAVSSYLLNATIVPSSLVGYLTLWQAGDPMPATSNLNSLDGDIVANGAIVSGGTSATVSAFAATSTPAHLVLDVFGTFSPSGSNRFYPLTPCRVADTRGNGFTGQFGTPSVDASTPKVVPVKSSSCNVPVEATAYVLNVTAVPKGPLGYLSVSPWSGTLTPVTTSTLNSAKGRIVANSAVVKAGSDSNGSILLQSSDPTDVVVDINGYFAP